MKRKVYVDSNILVAYFAKGKFRETVKKRQLIAAFSVIANLNIELFSSEWTITEFVKVMINEKKMSPKEINNIANKLNKEQIKIKEQKIKIIKASPSNNYTCDNLFFDVREVMTLYNPGFGDAFQVVIMRNNNFTEILSFDAKDDFSIIQNITVIHPKTFTKPSNGDAKQIN